MSVFDTITNTIKNEYEKSKEENRIRAERANDRALTLNITFGNRELGISSISVLKQRPDGIVYFNQSYDKHYQLVGYEWNGMNYEQHTTSNTAGTSTSTTVKNGKSGKMTAGAIIGTILMPGIGTAVGAAIGAGGKSKSKTDTSNYSKTQQVTSRVETNSTGIIRLRDIETNILYSIMFNCNSDIDTKLRCFNISQEKNISELSGEINESLHGVKALKELLDLGVISQEEFDIKKKQLLNL